MRISNFNNFPEDHVPGPPKKSCVFRTCMASHSNINYLVPVLEVCIPPPSMKNPGYGRARAGLLHLFGTKVGFKNRNDVVHVFASILGSYDLQLFGNFSFLHPFFAFWYRFFL